jgi:hypothetical protein
VTDSPAATREPGSYRDPSGFIFRRDGVLYRQINTRFADDWTAFQTSGLATDLISQQLLIPHEPASLELAVGPDALAVIEPEPIGFVSYPYEWAFSQLKDAALLTLEAQELADSHGMTLRDASAFNIQFRRGRPILIDSLSFERQKTGEPWKPYRQFCEHFLAPLALMAYRDGRLGLLLRDFIDGVPLDLAAELLPRRTRWSPGLAAHVHLHARAQRRHAMADSAAPSSVTMSDNRRRALLDHLKRTIEGLRLTAAGTQWAEYAEQTSYSNAGTAAKEATVELMLAAIDGRHAWDIGANTGRYSASAAKAGYEVVALDGDWAAVERHYLSLRKDPDERILPLLGDIADPSPGIGWANAERAPLLERADADVVMALALVHHLAIGRNVPLPMLGDLLARIAPNLIIEWVPKEDPMVQRLLAAREDVFSSYSLDRFRAAFASNFDVLEEAPISDSQRILFRMRARS